MKLKLAAPPSRPVTTSVNVNVPGEVGVPDKTPAEFKLIPVGSVLPEARLQVSGDTPPVAESVAEYVSLANPSGSVLAVVIVGTNGPLW